MHPYKSGFHQKFDFDVQHFRQNVIVNFSEVKVMIQGQNRRTEKSSTCNNSAVV